MCSATTMWRSMRQGRATRSVPLSPPGSRAAAIEPATRASCRTRRPEPRNRCAPAAEEVVPSSNETPVDAGALWPPCSPRAAVAVRRIPVALRARGALPPDGTRAADRDGRNHHRFARGQASRPQPPGSAPDRELRRSARRRAARPLLPHRHRAALRRHGRALPSGRRVSVFRAADRRARRSPCAFGGALGRRSRGAARARACRRRGRSDVRGARAVAARAARPAGGAAWRM